jgi:hypothetical protein
MATKKTSTEATLTPKMQQVIKGLYEPFPPDKIETRQGRAGQKWSFVASSEVINRLNEVFGCSWSVTEVESMVINNFVVKRVRLEVPDPDTGKTAIRDGWGGHAIGNDPGDSMKSAFSKALTKAASLFGVGLHLWGVSSENVSGLDDGESPPWEGPSQFGPPPPQMNVNVVNPGPHNMPPQGVQSTMMPPPQMANPNPNPNMGMQMPPQGPPPQQQQQPLGPVPQMTNPNVGYTNGPGTPATTQMPIQSIPQGPPSGQYPAQQPMAPPMGQMQQGTAGAGIVSHQISAIRGAATMAFGPNADPMLLVRQVLGAEAQTLQAVEELTSAQAVRVLEYMRNTVQGVQ